MGATLEHYGCKRNAAPTSTTSETIIMLTTKKTNRFIGSSPIAAREKQRAEHSCPIIEICSTIVKSTIVGSRSKQWGKERDQFMSAPVPESQHHPSAKKVHASGQVFPGSAKGQSSLSRFLSRRRSAAFFLLLVFSGTVVVITSSIAPYGLTLDASRRLWFTSNDAVGAVPLSEK